MYTVLFFTVEDILATSVKRYGTPTDGYRATALPAIDSGCPIETPLAMSTAKPLLVSATSNKISSTSTTIKPITKTTETFCTTPPPTVIQTSASIQKLAYAIEPKAAPLPTPHDIVVTALPVSVMKPTPAGYGFIEPEPLATETMSTNPMYGADSILMSSAATHGASILMTTAATHGASILMLSVLFFF
jgi:hypothetical protein